MKLSFSKKIGWALALTLIFVSAWLFASGGAEPLIQARWDGEHYLSIATRGYELNDCGPGYEAMGIRYCGNPWFPGWSYWNVLLSRLLELGASLPMPWVFFLSNLALLLTLVICLSRWSEELFLRQPVKKSLRTRVMLFSILFLFCQPGSFYFLTPFPYTFTLMGAVLFLRFYQKREGQLSWGGALAGAWASLSYPSAFLFGMIPLVDGLRCLNLWARMLIWGLVFMSGTLIVCLIFQAKFGLFWLYFDHQAQYSRVGRNPFTVLWDLAVAGHRNEQLTMLWYVTGAVLATWRLQARWKEPSLILIWAVILFSHLTGSWICIYRHYLLCLPLGALLGAARIHAIWLLLYFGLGLGLQLWHFLPQYLSGQLM